ncbi:phage tail length tape measure family protein [Delftia acidovorans]|uniref:phage tail length tape measure family protein n=1 Tax=Delftia acidovorans TaxID=80866 RepID=UPI0028A63B59|nr:phage tail length tape measure family protein [Delftia acidovorans]
MEIAALGLRVDADGVDRAARSLENLSAQGEKAEKAVGGIEKTAAKVQKSLEGLGKSGVDAGQSVKKVGDDSSAAKAPVDALGASADKAAQAEARLAEQAERAGMSVGAMKAALRGVPAQFTDIAVSLQGGMSPLTVFLQQGGQLKDMFNGAGNAAQALGSYVIGLVNPFTVAAAAAAALGVAYYQGSKELDALRLAIVTTGNATGVSVTELRQLAAEMGAVSGSEAKASAALASFARAGVQGIDTLKDYAQAAVDWEKTTGTSVEKTAKAFASLQEDPLKAAMDLQKGMNFLTVATYEQAKAFEDQGKKSEAAAVLQRQYAKALNQGSSEIRDNLGTLERSWDKLGKTASAVWGLMLGAGRSATLADQMGGLREEISNMERQLTERSGFSETGGGAATGRGARLNAKDVELLKERLRVRKEELSTLEKTAQQEKDAAEQLANRDRQLKALDEWNSRELKYLSDAEKLRRELNQERELGVRAGKSEKEILDRLAAIREEYAQKNKGAAREMNKEISEQAKVYAELAGLTSTYYTELARGQKQFEKGEITREQYVKFVETLIQKQPFVIAQKKEEAKVLQESLALAERERQQRLKAYASAEKNASSIQDGNKKLREEIELIGLSSEAQESILMQRERAILLVKQQHLAELERAEAVFGFMSREQIALMQEIEAMEERLALMGDKGIREKSARVGKQIEQDWEKVSQTISRTLSDYIMAGGTDAAVYLKRLFATLVLQPVVQAVVGGLIGGGGAGGAAATSLLGSAGSGLVSNLLFGGMSLTTVGSSIGAGIMATLTGSTLGGAGAAGILAGGSSALGMFGGALPYLGAGLALISLIKSFDKSGTPHYGADAVYSGGETTAVKRREDGALGYYDGAKYWNQGAQDFVNGVAKSVGGMLDSFAKSFGRETGYIVKTGFADDSSKDGAWGALQIVGPDGKTIVDWSKDQNNKWAPREFADGEAGQKQYLDMIAKDVAAAMSKTLGDADWATKALESVKDLDSLNAVLQQIGAVKAAFDGWAKTLTGFADITGKAQTELLKFAGGIEALTNNINAFYAGFYSEAERAEILQRQVREQLKGLGVDIDPANGEAAKKALRKLIEDALASGDNELAAKLLAMAQLFGVAADYAQKSAETAAEAAKTAAEEAARALEEAQQKAKDLAMANFEAAIAREQQYWQAVASNAQEAVQAITGILTPLKQAAKELFGSIESVGQMQAVQGMLYIERAIAGLRGGAKLSSYDGLTDAISAARGGITSGRYASQFERDRDALVLANQLKQIAGYGDTQLSVEERQLKNSQEQLQRLDKTLTYWRDLLDGNKAQIDATLSVEQAIKALMPFLDPNATTQPPGQKPGSGGNSEIDFGGTAPGGGGASSGSKWNLGAAKPDANGGYSSYAVWDGKYQEALANSGGSVRELIEQFRESGGSLDKLAVVGNVGLGDLQKLVDEMGIPRFDVGTNRVPQDMLAMVHRNEAIVPAAFNPWAGGSMGSGNLEGLVQQLLSEAVQSREERRQQAGEIVRLNAQIARLLQRWDGDGLPHEREEATA